MVKKSFAVLIFLSLTILFTSVNAQCLTNDEIISKIDTALAPFPEKIAELKQDVKRVVLYTIRTDKTNVNDAVAKQIEGKVISSFLKVQRPTLIYSPEVRPMRITTKDNVFKFTSGFQSTEEIKEASRKLRFDGFLEGDFLLTDTAVYLNLRIVDTESLSVVWSNDFTSQISTANTQPSFGTDFGIGFGGMQIGETASSGQIAVPPFVNYISFDGRISLKTVFSETAKVTFTAGALYLYSGIESTIVPQTMVSMSKNAGSFNPYGRVGIRLPLISVKRKPGTPKRDILATEFNFGKICGWDVEKLRMFDVLGVRVETDIAENISLGLGVSYVSLYEIMLKSGTTDIRVKVGGLYYELSILRFNFTL
ncbi:MAG: hypothetical protein WC955_05290 [Elusimicrobiota bacterium]